MSQNFNFYAISYTWGDSGFTEKTSINGQVMAVTKNCHYALTQVNDRYPSSPGNPVYIWIDSICINQDDNDEKSYQVAMMGDIYTKAFKVLACIGPHEDNSEMLSNILDSVMTLSPELYRRREESPLEYSNYDFMTEDSYKQLFKAKVKDFVEMCFRNLQSSTNDYGMQFMQADARIGDKLFYIPIMNRMLVLRQGAEEDEFDIVGQGLLNYNYKFPSSAVTRWLLRKSFNGDREKSQENEKGDVELKAEPIDIMVLFGQDRGNNGSCIWEKTCERLATKIYGTVKLVR
ncbi:hypothetical protein IL306_003236 [Fusarium sp. DS 682]|nr:hypothetical protein IL306_003236 [Fusarium sp. DS 682]